MSREKIQTWFNEFFEFSTKDRSTVTSVSCKLFGEHVFNKQQERIAELESVADNQIWPSLGDGWSADYVLGYEKATHDMAIKLKGGDV